MLDDQEMVTQRQQQDEQQRVRARQRDDKARDDKAREEQEFQEEARMEQERDDEERRLARSQPDKRIDAAPVKPSAFGASRQPADESTSPASEDTTLVGAPPSPASEDTTLVGAPSAQRDSGSKKKIAGLLLVAVLLAVSAFMVFKSTRHHDRASVAAITPSPSVAAPAAGLLEPAPTRTAHEVAPAPVVDLPARIPAVATLAPDDAAPETQAVGGAGVTALDATDAGAAIDPATTATEVQPVVVTNAELGARLDRIEALLQEIKGRTVSGPTASTATSAALASTSATPRTHGTRRRPRRAVADSAPTPAGPPMSGQLVSVDLWGGTPSVVVASGLPGDGRVRVLRQGDVYNGVVLQAVDPVARSATFGTPGSNRSFTLNMNQGG